MTSAQVVQTSVTNNTHPDDHTIQHMLHDKNKEDRFSFIQRQKNMLHMFIHLGNTKAIPLEENANFW